MAALIFSGSVLAYLLNADAGRVAVASFVAFAAAGICNAVVYHLLRRRGRMVRMNGSNALAAVADSVVFPFIAFDVVSAALCVAQATSKFLGGLLWTSLYVLILRFIPKERP